MGFGFKLSLIDSVRKIVSILRINIVRPATTLGAITHRAAYMWGYSSLMAGVNSVPFTENGMHVVAQNKDNARPPPYPVTRFHYVWRATCSETVDEDTEVTCALTKQKPSWVWSQWKYPKCPMALMWNATPARNKEWSFCVIAGFALLLKFHT